MKFADQVRESLEYLTGILEHEERNLDAKLDDLERQLARARAAKAVNGESRARAGGPMPRENICPICWVMLGIESGLTNPDAEVAEEMEGLEILQCSHRADGLRCKWHATPEA